jgi:hypothetical protein
LATGEKNTGLASTMQANEFNLVFVLLNASFNAIKYKFGGVTYKDNGI